MISGSADREATTEWAATHGSVQYRPLRPDGPLVSPAGFGCYRVSGEAEPHRRALQQALLAGVNLIDTSANYADGKSEQLVGRILDGLVREGRIRREAVVVVSKVGYLQGKNLQISKQVAAGIQFRCTVIGMKLSGNRGATCCDLRLPDG